MRGFAGVSAWMAGVDTHGWKFIPEQKLEEIMAGRKSDRNKKWREG